MLYLILSLLFIVSSAFVLHITSGGIAVIVGFLLAVIGGVCAGLAGPVFIHR